MLIQVLAIANMKMHIRGVSVIMQLWFVFRTV